MMVLKPKKDRALPKSRAYGSGSVPPTSSETSKTFQLVFLFWEIALCSLPLDLLILSLDITRYRALFERQLDILLLLLSIIVLLGAMQERVLTEWIRIRSHKDKQDIEKGRRWVYAFGIAFAALTFFKIMHGSIIATPIGIAVLGISALGSYKVFKEMTEAVRKAAVPKATRLVAEVANFSVLFIVAARLIGVIGAILNSEGAGFTLSYLPYMAFSFITLLAVKPNKRFFS